jgi:EmrB/QacA subfamily drug resistance transporter
MQMLDATVVATALPAMAQALGTSVIRLNVAITSYLLAVAVLVPVDGWAADRFGARRVFIAAITLFTLSSVACALSSTLTQLIAARIIQGMAGAMMVPVGRIILLRLVPKQDLLRAMAFLSMPALLGPVIGPPLGGFLVTYASWHWIFLINIPIGLLGIALVLRFIAEVKNVDTPRLDLPGFLLSAICLAALVSAFEALGHGLLSGPWLAALVALGVGSGLLYGWHAKHTAHPIIDFSLLRIPTFRVSVTAGNLCRFTVSATPFLLAVLLQVGFGLTPFAAGMITFASAAGALVMKFVAKPIVQQFGFQRTLTWNAVLTGAFIAMCAFFTPTTSAWLMIATLLMGGFFRSLQFTGVNTLTYADITPSNLSQASSFAAMAQQLGISLGVGVAAVTLNLSMTWRGAHTIEIRDIAAGFLVIGLIAGLSSLSFTRLARDAGAQLNQREP